MTAYTDRLESALAEAGILAARCLRSDGTPGFDIADDVQVEVMLDLVALGGKPYVVFGPTAASPHMDTPEEVVAYLRDKGLIAC